MASNPLMSLNAFQQMTLAQQNQQMMNDPTFMQFMMLQNQQNLLKMKQM
jgi:hypothetical protein